MWVTDAINRRCQDEEEPYQHTVRSVTLEDTEGTKQILSPSRKTSNSSGTLKWPVGHTESQINTQNVYSAISVLFVFGDT